MSLNMCQAGEEALALPSALRRRLDTALGRQSKMRAETQSKGRQHWIRLAGYMHRKGMTMANWGYKKWAPSGVAMAGSAITVLPREPSSSIRGRPEGNECSQHKERIGANSG